MVPLQYSGFQGSFSNGYRFLLDIRLTKDVMGTYNPTYSMACKGGNPLQSLYLQNS